MALRVLILGGTQLSRTLATQLGRDARYTCLLSFAGRTEKPQLPDVPCRVGGFGGAAGLATFLADFDVLVDATHPFAAQISRNASEAAARASVALLRLVTPAWQPQDGDRWTHVADMHAAADAIGSAPRRVFLTIGRLEIDAFARAPQHRYLARAVDMFDPGLTHARVLAARGPFSVEDERSLMERERIDCVVSKNAGTQATYAKLVAARELGIPVIMVARPTLPSAHEVADVEGALRWLHASSGSERGV